jgi:hypothetical protein
MAMDPTLDQIEQLSQQCRTALDDIDQEISPCDNDDAGTTHDPGAAPHNNPPDLATKRNNALMKIQHALQDLVQCHDELSHGGGSVLGAN